MTKAEFLKKNNFLVEILAIADKTGELLTGKITELCFKTGATVNAGDKIYEFKNLKTGKDGWSHKAEISGKIQYFVSLGEEFKPGSILATIENQKMSRLWDNKSAEYEKLVEEHRKSGDFVEWWLNERDKNADIFYIIESFATENEFNEYKTALFPHIDALIEEHKEKGDFVEWVFDCKKKDHSRYIGILSRDSGKKLLREKFQREISEHREKGDVIDYLWEIIEKYNLSWWCLYKYSISTEDEKSLALSENRPLEYLILRDLLKREEGKELEYLYDIVSKFGERCEDMMTWRTRDEFKHILKLFQSPKDSVEYKRYEKIKSRITKAVTLENLEESIKITTSKQRFKKILFIGVPIFIVVLVICILVAL